MSSVWQRAWTWFDAAATRGRILLVGWLTMIVYAYPGYMTWDSVQQLQEARHPPITDWHPPMMAVLWRFTDTFIAGPFPMLVIQTGTFVLGLAAILSHFMRPRVAAIITIGVLLFPPVMVVMAVIWKDSLMAGVLLAGAGAMMSPDRRWRVVGCVLLAFATSLRYNALAATLPMVLLLFQWREGLTWVKRYALALGVWFAITVAAFGASRIATGKKSHAWHNSVALLDIAGILHDAPPMPDTEVREHLAGIPLRVESQLQKAFLKAYDPNWWGPLVFGDARLMDMPGDDAAVRAAVSSAWWSLVSSHPAAYFKHRRRVFWGAIALSQPPSAAVWDGFVTVRSEGDLIDHMAHRSDAQAWIVKQVRRFEPTMLFRAWAYLLLALLLLPLCGRSRMGFVMLVSGIIYELTLIVAAPSSDFRYSHWMILCTVLGIIFVIRSRMRARS